MKKHTKQFEQLLNEYQAGLLEGRQRELMDQWFDSFDERESENWPESNRSELKMKILSSIDYVQAKQLNIIPQRSNMRWAKVAAAVVVLAISSIFVWEYANEFKKTGTTLIEKRSLNGIEKVMLPDGSIIWLKEFSKLTFPNQFTGSIRNVSLEGEALFEVAKDPNHPFIIKCGDLETTVLGTSFNIRAQKHNVEVTVLTGKVSLASSKSDQKVVLSSNETGIYKKEAQEITKLESSKSESKMAIAGTEYFMKFEDSDMAIVIDKIEKKFNVQVKLEDATLANCRITADFTDQSLNRTLAMISQALGVSYNISDGRVMIKGKGCEN